MNSLTDSSLDAFGRTQTLSNTSRLSLYMCIRSETKKKVFDSYVTKLTNLLESRIFTSLLGEFE